MSVKKCFAVQCVDSQGRMRSSPLSRSTSWCALSSWLWDAGPITHFQPFAPGLSRVAFASQYRARFSCPPGCMRCECLRLLLPQSHAGDAS
jgi:hypothetical protein